MLIRAVRAYAFGPLADQTLTLADGMTVVYGPNESAKSSWHAAVYAALCGRRRGRVPAAEERRFADLHRPWDRDDWLVGAEVMLDDGRRLEVRQDLAGRVDCDVHDLDLGRDCSAEFLADGAPDLTRWLGLDRSTFQATAFVAQAQVLAVYERAGGLQRQLQRAVATAGADETAASAIERIDGFRREWVGSQRAPARPMRRAEAAVQGAQVALDRARAAHAAYEERLVDAARLKASAATADRRLRLHEAVALAAIARTMRTAADEAAALRDRLGEPRPRHGAEGRAAMAEVTAALAAWEAQMPGGAGALIPPQRQAGDAAHAAGGPAASGAAEQELTRTLEPPGDPVGPGTADRVTAARTRLARAERATVRDRWLAGAGLAAVLTAAAVLLANGTAPSAVVPTALTGPALGLAGLACAALLIFAGLAAFRTGRDVTAARAELEAAALETARRQAGRAALVDRDRVWLDAIEATRRRAGDQVLAAARRCELAPDTAEEAVPLLRQWQTDYAQQAAVLDLEQRARARLDSLLGGRSVADLQREAAAAEVKAGDAAGGFGDEDLMAAAAEVSESPGGSAALLPELRALARAADRRSAEAEGSRRALESELSGIALAPGGAGDPAAAEPTGVGAAEEQHARAEAELHRLRELDETLELTRRFLTAAQERAHRTIAPVLADAIRSSLPDVTGGRYTEVTVDPERLRVQVRAPAGRWRSADVLSHGTAEQVYLLLRIALARHLAHPGRSCPVLLDEVTVHADAHRTEQILEQLLLASADRQIIVFTQQGQVRDWARRRLTGAPHVVRELGLVATS